MKLRFVAAGVSIVLVTGLALGLSAPPTKFAVLYKILTAANPFVEPGRQAITVAHVADGLRHPEIAVEYLSRALDLLPSDNPHFSATLIDLGNIHERQGNIPEAIANFTRAIDNNSKHPEYNAITAIAHFNRAKVLNEALKNREALADAERFLETIPNSPAGYRVRGEILADMGRKPEAMASFEKALALETSAVDPDPYKRAYRRAYLESRLGHLNAALEGYTKAIEQKPKPSFFVNLARIYAAKGELTLAVSDYTRALEMDPSEETALVGRGISYKKMGRFEDAIRDFDTAISIDRNSWMGYINRGSAFEALNRPDLANRDYLWTREITGAGPWLAEAIRRTSPQQH